MISSEASRSALWFAHCERCGWKGRFAAALSDRKLQVARRADMAHGNATLHQCKGVAVISPNERLIVKRKNLSSGVESRHAVPTLGENSAESGYAESGSSAPPAQNNLPVPVLAESSAPTTVADHAAATYETVFNPLGRKAATASGEARESTYCSTSRRSDPKAKSDSPAGKPLSDSEVGSMLCPCCGGYEAHKEGCTGKP